MTLHLVTGGAGFIGSHIVNALLKKGEKVRVLDNFYSGKKENLQECAEDVEVIEGDITDSNSLNKAVKDVDIIYHQAAIPSVPKSIQNPIVSNHANITGTLKLLHAAKENNVSRFICAASSSAYGNSPTLPKKEDMVASPLSPYAVNKYVGELYCKVFYEIYGLETISLRYFNVFGPNQDPNSEYAAVIPNFIQKMIHNEAPIIFGNGHQSRDFTFIDNVVSANLLASQASNLKGEVVNVGCGESITLNELVSKINSNLGRDIKPLYQDERQGDVQHSLADINKIQNLIGYEPQVSFDEGLKKTVTWFQSCTN